MKFVSSLISISLRDVTTFFLCCFSHLPTISRFYERSHNGKDNNSEQEATKHSIKISPQRHAAAAAENLQAHKENGGKSNLI